MGADVEIEGPDDAGPDGPADDWGARTARSLAMAATMSRVLFVGAVVALALGVLSATLTYTSMDTTGSFGQVATFDSTGSRLALAQASSTLLGSLLPAGLLAAAAMAIRLQAARFEVDVLGD
jgi:hypothetical protein